MHPPRDRGLGHAEDFRGFGVGELLTGDEDRRVSVGGLEFGDGVLEPDRVIEIPAVWLADQAGEHCELFGKAAERAACNGTTVIVTTMLAWAPADGSERTAG